MESMSSSDEDEQDATSQQYPQPQTVLPSSKAVSALGSVSEHPPSRSLVSLPKRKRVSRACDECRRKKIKCDGKQPCTHCTVYGYDCAFDQPSNRRRNPAPAYIQSVESRLHKVEAILKVALPGINLEDPNFDAYSIDQIIESSKRFDSELRSSRNTYEAPGTQLDDSQSQTLVEGTGSLELDDHGHWHYHGTSSAFAFMQKLRVHLSHSSGQHPPITASQGRTTSTLTEPAKSAPFPHDPSVPSPVDLPERKTAIRLCQNTLEVACALMRFIHKPTFQVKFDRIFDTDPENYTNADTQFLPLLYVIMAIGCLFSHNDRIITYAHRYGNATEQGFHYFQAARNLLDITDCRDLTTLQAMVFMIMFLQSTAKLATCYSYIGIALRSCCRLGLHRDITSNFNIVEREERKRIFWLIRKMDAYVGAMLGLPQMLSEEDVDQELPLDVDDEFIAVDGISTMPPGYFPLIRGSNAHTGLVPILQKVMKYIYPVKITKSPTAGETYSISHSRIREIELDLQSWMGNLPPELSASDNASADLARVQQLLRLSYAHVQLMMYRPFLPLLRPGAASEMPDKQSYACAITCVNVARNIVYITREMRNRCLLVGSHWFVMYTSYFSILSLVYVIFNNPESSSARDNFKDAIAGREVLDSLAEQSLAADRCSRSLTDLFIELPRKVLGQRSSPYDLSPSYQRRRSIDEAKGHHSNFDRVLDGLPAEQYIIDSTSGAADREDVSSLEKARQPSVPTSKTVIPGAAPSAFANQQQPWTGAWDPGVGSRESISQSTRQLLGSEHHNTPTQLLYNQQSRNYFSGLRGAAYPTRGQFTFADHGLKSAEGPAAMQPSSLMEQREDVQMTTDTSQPANLLHGNFGGSTSRGFLHPNPTQLQYPDTNPQTRYYFPENGPVPEMDTVEMSRNFWQQLGNGRTGQTPSIDLDDLFGAEGSWNPPYGDMDFVRSQQP